MMEKFYYEQLEKLKVLVEMTNNTRKDRHKKLVSLQEFYILGFIDCMKYNVSRTELIRFRFDYTIIESMKQW